MAGLASWTARPRTLGAFGDFPQREQASTNCPQFPGTLNEGDRPKHSCQNSTSGMGGFEDYAFETQLLNRKGSNNKSALKQVRPLSACPSQIPAHCLFTSSVFC